MSSVLQSQRGKSGFTLLEMLVSITILSIMVVSIARIVADTGRATRAGHQQVYDDSNARTAMNLIMDDLMECVNEPYINNFELDTGDTTYAASLKADSLRFTVFGGPNFTGTDADSENTLQTVRYYVASRTDTDGNTFYTLNRATQWGVERSDISGYPILEHVVEFRAIIYNDNRTQIGASSIDYMPAFVNIYIAVISDEDHRRARRLGDTQGSVAMTSFIEKNARRYFTQAFLPVRKGRKLEFNYPVP